MAEQEFGPLRSKAARKPWPECPEVVIYRCSHCGRMYQRLGYEVMADGVPTDGALSDGASSEGVPAREPVCCQAPMEQLQPLAPTELVPEIKVDYRIVGGFNQSAVQVFWETQQPEEKPEWILLKTFTGGYQKYLTPRKQPPLVFPLSDEDAYVYCDRNPCEQCLFRCKRGFIIYVYFKSRGLVAVPLEKMSEYFKA